MKNETPVDLIAGAIRTTVEALKANRFQYEGRYAYPIDQTQQLRGLRQAAENLRDALAKDGNFPSFDGDAFLEACGYAVRAEKGK